MVSGNAGWTRSPNSPAEIPFTPSPMTITIGPLDLPDGPYEVRISLDGQVAGSAYFHRENAATSNATA